MKKTEIDFDKLKDDWPSPFVAREKIEEFTKGMYKSRSMSTFDSADEGVDCKYKLGRIVFYLVDDVIAWLKNRRRRIK